VEVLKDSILNHVLQRMAGGYAEQIPYYEKMWQLAQSQGNLLAEENLDIEQLMEFIDQRQQLINKLEDLNSSLLPLKKEVKEALEITEFNLSSIKEKLSGHGVAALSTVFEQLAQLLSEIKEMDRKNEGILRHCIQATQDELKNLQNLKKVNKAYQAEPTADGGVFIDYSK
jgi:flagellar biosynthesis/type III secretory pathway chaperone